MWNAEVAANYKNCGDITTEAACVAANGDRAGADLDQQRVDLYTHMQKVNVLDTVITADTCTDADKNLEILGMKTAEMSETHLEEACERLCARNR